MKNASYRSFSAYQKERVGVALGTGRGCKGDGDLSLERWHISSGLYVRTQVHPLVFDLLVVGVAGQGEEQLKGGGGSNEDEEVRVPQRQVAHFTLVTKTAIH